LQITYFDTLSTLPNFLTEKKIIHDLLLLPHWHRLKGKPMKQRENGRILEEHRLAQPQKQ
jgi:hypothetical protein